MLMTFEFACESIYSFGETTEQESFFFKVLFAVFRPLFGRVCGEELSFVTKVTGWAHFLAHCG